MQTLSYSIKGAAEAIGVGKSTIYRRIKAGEIPTFKWGGRTLIDADALREVVKRQQGTSPNHPSAPSAS
jgi:excisionase family DNA binding protein